MSVAKCEICGAASTPDAAEAASLCAQHRGAYRVFACPGCGVRIMQLRELDVTACGQCVAKSALAQLPPALLADVDELVRARSWLQGILLLRRHDPRLGIHDAQALLFERARQINVQPTPKEPSLAELRERIDVIRLLTPAAIEAVWDGDTVHDWFVGLVAIIPTASTRGFAEHHVTTFFGAGAAARASEMGKALAERLGVPFFFSSPERADDRAPRWWDRRG
jgi:hypothetical protein